MIEFVNVSKMYPVITALEEVSFEIDEGEFTFLVGPSGSGKTTIIKLLIKEEEPTEGSIYFNDADITRLKGSKVAQLRRDISVVFQDFKLLPHKNLYENVAFGLEVAGKKREDIDETVAYVLELIDLADRTDAFPDQISGGEKQKVAIARAVANNPKVLIADEPTGNLDPDSSWDIIHLLSKINQWGTTVIMATHGSDIVNTLGKRVIQLDRGRIIADNKKGSYPQPVIPLATPKTKKATKKKPIAKKQKDKKKSKGKPEKKNVKKKTSHKKDKIQEKDFEITFTTKQKIPESKKKKEKKKRKRKGKDVVDLYKLELPDKILDTLLKSEVTTIKNLRKILKKDATKIKGLNEKEIRQIEKALEKKGRV